ncbi:MAG: COQ9 family protein [Neomegalonema sp.]|nr:COQ9 family protein [Neomegalonema sp.]
MEDPMVAIRRRILAAALPNVPFDGWTEEALRIGTELAGASAEDAKLAFPRGGVDLALFFHDEGDRELTARLSAMDLSEMRIRERVVAAVKLRLDIAEANREAVRRGATLFAVPLYAPDGARAVWSTADAIWTALGDPSDDLNWYSKRAILASVYGATVLYWLGDESAGRERTWEFLDRRIAGVMRFEKAKAAVNKNPLGRLLMTGPNWVASKVRKPGARRDAAAGERRFDAPGGK